MPAHMKLPIALHPTPSQVMLLQSVTYEKCNYPHLIIICTHITTIKHMMRCSPESASRLGDHLRRHNHRAER